MNANYIIMETWANNAQSKLITLGKEDAQNGMTIKNAIENRMAELKEKKLSEEQIKACGKKRTDGVMKFMGAPVIDKISGEIYYVWMNAKGEQTYVSEYFYTKKLMDAEVRAEEA